MRKICLLLCILLLCTSCTKQIEEDVTTAVAETAMREECIVFYGGESFPKTMFLPEDGRLLLGVSMEEEKEINTIEAFEETVGEQDIYSFTVSLTEPFPMIDVLECYTKGKIPLLRVIPPDRNAPFQEVWLAEGAKKAGEYRIPLLVDFYPNGQEYGIAKEYCDYYQKAREYFREFAPNATFVWSMGIDAVEYWEDYYPGDTAVEYIGLDVYVSGTESWKEIESPLFRWYTVMAGKKPLLISRLGISYYSQKTSTYTERETAKLIQNFYEHLVYFPDIVGVVYHSVDLSQSNIKKLKGEKYSLMGNEMVKQAYQKANRAVPKRDGRQWKRSVFSGYRWKGKLYIRQETVIRELQTTYTGNPIEWEGDFYVLADAIEGYAARVTEQGIFLQKEVS